MPESPITSRTHIKALREFFLNPGTGAYRAKALALVVWKRNGEVQA